MVDNGVFRDIDGSLNLQPLIRPMAIVVTSCTVAVFGSLWIVSRLYSTRSFDHIALRQEMKSEEGFTGVVSGLESLVGSTVTVFSDMRPGGKVQAEDGRILEATLKFGGFAAKGTSLKVISAEQGRLYCEVK
jgi:membrane-bound ClpP family serine protease